MLPRIPLDPANSDPGSLARPRARILTILQNCLYITYSFVVGFFLLCLPWMEIWENNYLLYLYPQLRPLITNSYFKGGVLGLGIVNILIGIQEMAGFRSILKSHSS